MSGFWKCIKYIPIVIFVGVPLSIFITYGIAIFYDHVYPNLPYVSDTGTLPPESCYFSFFLSTISFLLIISSYVRYREVSELLRLKPTIKLKPWCNKLAFSIAIISAVGLNIVACFQESNLFTIHILGAILCFFGGTGFFIFQTVFTRRITPEAKSLFGVRVFLTTVNILCTVGTFAPLHWAIENYKGDNILKWSEKDGGYELHLVSTYFEWLLIYSLAAYMFTFYWDFKKFDLEPPVVKFKRSDHRPAPAPAPAPAPKPAPPPKEEAHTQAEKTPEV